MSKYRITVESLDGTEEPLSWDVSWFELSQHAPATVTTSARSSGVRFEPSPTVQTSIVFTQPNPQCHQAIQDRPAQLKEETRFTRLCKVMLRRAGRV